MIKILNPSVVKIVGSIASVLLRHLKYWKDSSGREVVYRTNTQLVEDLEGMFSASQIQRAKKKLIENGLIEITYGKGYDRTTHYSLTKKAIDLLDSSKSSSEASGDTKVNTGTTVPSKPKSKEQHGKKMPKSNVSQAMKESFDKQGKERSNVVKGVPDALKHLLKNKEEDIHEEEDEVTQQDYDECDIAMLNSLNNSNSLNIPVEYHQDDLTENKLTSGQLLGSLSSVYKSGVSEARERIYQMSQLQNGYLEDY
jgi:hypothetical protein